MSPMYIGVLYVCSKVLFYLFIIIILFGYFVVLLWNVVTRYCGQVDIWY